MTRRAHRCWPAVRNLFTAVPGDPETRLPPLPPTDGAEFATRLSAQLRRHPCRLMAACLATVLGPTVVAHAGSLGGAPPAAIRVAAEQPPAPTPAPRPGDSASWLPHAAEAAATCPGLPSEVLVAIAQVESSLGQRTWTSSAGAVGPMQFLPATWSAYGADGDGDGSVDVMNAVDAVHGAARLLCANGGGDPERLASALWNYNHSEEYVRQVLAVARTVRS